MGQLTTAPEQLHVSRRSGSRKWWVIAGAVLIAVVAVFAFLFSVKWPFTRDGMIRRLERASSAQVEFRSFHTTYFPPGCVAEGVVFRKTERGASRTLLSIDHLRIQSSYPGLIGSRKRIEKISVSGAHLFIPAGGVALERQQSSQKSGSDNESLVIREFEAKDSLLELAPKKPDSRPLQFAIHEAVFRNLATDRTIPFTISMRLPLPPGELRTSGWIGPWRDNAGTVRSTPISGSSVLEQADLSAFKSIAGRLSAHVNFSGTLQKLKLTGSTDSPDFVVRKSGHKFPLQTEFAGTVDLLSGDVELPSLHAKLGDTTLAADARVTGYPKTVELNVNEGRGRVQDLILLFSDAPRSPMNGPIRFQTKVVLPPEHRKFEQRVRLSGDFAIDQGKFTASDTREHVDELSLRARGEKDKDPDAGDQVLSKLAARVTLANGIAKFPALSFSVPGAVADMHGTYNLLNKRVDLRGKMKMAATVSEATKGVKSFFLKVLDPFYKKKNAGADVPVSMTGVYGHTHFSAGLKSK